MAPPYYLANPTGVSGGDTTPGQPTDLPWISSTGDDPGVAMVHKLMSTMGISPAIETMPMPQQPQLKTWQRILGAIGDGLMARAAVQSGGQPQPGAFFRAQMERQKAFRDALNEAMATNVKTRNTVRLGMAEEAQKAEDARRLAAIKTKPALKERLGVVGSEIHKIRDVVDPTTGETLYTHDLGPAPQGYAYQQDLNGNIIQFPTSGPPQGSTGGGPIGASTGVRGKPTASANPKTMTDEAGNQLQFDAKTGKWIPSVDLSGKNVKKAPSANLQGIQQQLDNASLLLANMRANYNQALKQGQGGIIRGVGTAIANTAGGETGAKFGLSGLAGKLNAKALKHERDREAVATSLAFPLTGSRRSVEGARQSLLRIIPHFSDPPDVWKFFEDQMREVIANSRKMPWGTTVNNADTYAADLDRAMLNLGGTTIPPVESGAGSFSGQSMTQDQYDELMDSEKKRWTDGGGTVR